MDHKTTTIGGLLGKAYARAIGDKAKYRRAWTELAALRSNGLCRSILQLRNAVSGHPPVLAVWTDKGR